MAVILSPVGGAAAQFFSNNGVPLSGGKLYTYAAGTTTPRATYTSSSGSTPHANPIVLDSGGRVPGGELWLTNGVSYKFVLKDSTDVLIATYDNIVGINASTDAALVTYNEGDIGAVTYTVRAKLQQTVSVKDFGATGDGTTNDTVAIQAALDTGKSVYIPQGTYLVSSALQLKTTSQMVFGDGQQSVLLTTTDIETMYSSTNVFGVVLSDLQFKNTVSEILTGPTHFHVHFGTGASGCVIRNCGFNTALTGAYVRTTHHAGVWFEGANLNNILDCTFGQAQILMGSTDSTIRGGFIYSFSFQYAIKITASGDVMVDGVRGILGGADKGCIWIPDPSYMIKIVNNYFGGTYSSINIGAGITADQPQVMQIIGNTFHEVDKDGIHLTNAVTGTTIMGNSFFAGDPKQNDPTGLLPGYADIYIGDTSPFYASNVTITGNVFDRFVGPVEDGMPGIGKSFAIAFDNVPDVTTNNIATNNTIVGTGTRYYDPPITSSAFNSVTNNAGAKAFVYWTPIDVSGASLTFTNVDCKYVKTLDSVTVWASFTFPTTTSVAGVSIYGIPQVPLAGMIGAIGALDSTSASVQKVKLVPGQGYFLLCNSTGTQVSNAVCSGLTFNFSGTYLYQ
jgi:hypothetical protein